MAADNDRTLRNVLEKLELLTGERSEGSRRAVLISELDNLIDDLSNENAAIKKALTELSVEFKQSSASITQELLVRADENSALAQIVTTLKAQLGDAKAEIQDTKRALATKNMALADSVTMLSASLNTNTASVNDERLARATADGAIALAVTQAAAGASRVYTQSTAPTASGRIQGDVWYDTLNNFKPYVWYSGAWQDNSSGAYSKYVGEIATLTQSLSATKTGVDNLSYEYRLQGTFGTTTLSDGSSFSGILFTGGRQRTGTDASGNPIYSTNSNILLAANTIKLDGNVIITGSVNNPKIANNAVSNSSYAEGGSGTTVYLTCRAGARVSILITNCGGGVYSFNPNGTLYASVGGSGAVATQSIFGALVSGAINGSANIFSGGWTVMPTTLLTLWTAPSDGTYSFTASSDGSPASWTHKILVMELSR